jgi:hypothetical protein
MPLRVRQLIAMGKQMFESHNTSPNADRPQGPQGKNTNENNTKKPLKVQRKWETEKWETEKWETTRVVQRLFAL